MNRESERKRLVELLQIKSCWYNDCETGCDKCGNVGVSDTDIEKIADHLLDNGIVVPPVKVGTTVNSQKGCFFLPYEKDINPKEVISCEVIAIKETKKGKYILLKPLLIETFGMRSANEWFPFSAIGKTVFTSREDAVKALEGKEDEGK